MVAHYGSRYDDCQELGEEELNTKVREARSGEETTNQTNSANEAARKPRMKRKTRITD